MDRREFIGKSIAGSLLGASALSILSACKKRGYEYKIGAFDSSMGGAYASVPEALDAAKSIGLDGVQITSKQRDPSKPFMDSETIDAYIKRGAQTGMLFCSICTNGMSTHPFTYEPNAVSYMQSAIDSAAKLKCSNILLPFFGPANQQDETKKMDKKHFAPLVAKLKELAPYAKKKGVVICMENAITSDDNKRIIDAVGSDFVKVYFDTFNSEYYGHKSVPEIRALAGGYIGQVHFKATGHKLDAPGGYPEDMPGCVDALLDIGYKGWLVLELHGFKPAKDGPELETLKHNADWLRGSKFFA